MRKNLALLYIPCLLICLIVALSCAPTASYKDNHAYPDPLDQTATGINLAIYDLYGSRPLGTLVLPMEGGVTIYVGDTAVHPSQDLEIYARTEGYYTGLYFCQNNSWITVDLDQIPPAQDAMTGVIIGMQGWGQDHYVRDLTVIVRHKESDFSYKTISDSQGRWGIQNAPLGSYEILLPLNNGFSPYTDTLRLTATNSHANDYIDLLFYDDVQVDAPNIYLYPESQTDISVSLAFPSGGGIILSDPPYNTGWNVNVSPEGLIDGHFDYLFYEAKVGMPLQHTYGWLLDGSKLEQELRQLLLIQNFVGREIDDFIDFWLPRINGSAWYAICPQDVELMSTLTISPKPDTILRALYTIRPIDRKVNLITPPKNINFERLGFTIVEWGVIDWHD